MADCSKCDGHCCKYVTVELDPPKEDIDFEELKWFLCHENVTVYIDHEDGWYVEFQTPCKFQDPKTNLCKIYEKRTRVCAEHGTEDCEDADDCEEFYKRLFTKPEDIEAYREEIKKS